MKETKCNETFLDVKWSMNPYTFNGYNKFCYSSHNDTLFTETMVYGTKFMQPKAESWMEARDNCQALGGDLVSINNELELHFLMVFEMQSKESGAMWLGLNDRIWLLESDF